ncbi:hypothetical protein [Actinokineospora sp. HUAS TT18]|uniref:hypothetical protein n=1 Tax=Actinokineospora sp. HUAS TT18 TaxID=3447451 RepID=UPI003F5264C6
MARSDAVCRAVVAVPGRQARAVAGTPRVSVGPRVWVEEMVAVAQLGLMGFQRVLTGVPSVGAGRPDSGALVVVARPVGMRVPVVGVGRLELDVRVTVAA